MRRGDAGRRLDASYHHPALRQNLQKLEKSPFNVATLRTLLSSQNGIRYGTGTPPPLVEPSNESVPFIRATDIKDGEIIVSGLLHISAAQEKSMKKCLVSGNELIIVRSGVNTGDCAVVPKSLAGSYAAYDLILQFSNKVVPAFVSEFLNTQSGRAQLNVLKGRAAQPHLNAEEVSSIKISLPPLNIQQTLVSDIETARESRKRKLVEADVLLAGIDGFLLEQLGLAALEEDNRQVFAVRLKQVRNRRIDASSYRPYFKSGVQITTPLKSLGDIADIDSNPTTPPSNDETLVPYVGLPECDLNEVREVVLRPYKEVRGRSVVKPGDILFARIEPSVFNRKYVFADDLKGHDQAYTSTEFYVVQGKERVVEQGYLYAMFFCSFVFTQVKGKTTGSSGRRRIDPDMFASLQIPLPDIVLQKSIAAEITRRRDEARRLRAEAAKEWEAAKVGFERQLLG